jgi:hypothetical protein
MSHAKETHCLKIESSPLPMPALGSAVFCLEELTTQVSNKQDVIIDGLFQFFAKT